MPGTLYLPLGAGTQALAPFAAFPGALAEEWYWKQSSQDFNWLLWLCKHNLTTILASTSYFPVDKYIILAVGDFSPHSQESSSVFISLLFHV